MVTKITQSKYFANFGQHLFGFRHLYTENLEWHIETHGHAEYGQRIECLGG